MNHDKNEHSTTDNGPSSPQTGGHNPRILVTAGPTWEPIDQVRYLGNRSSGLMGLQCAKAFIAGGCPTTLLRGPGTATPEPSVGLSEERFQSAEELKTALIRLWPSHDILIMAAAVADFRPCTQPDGPAKYRRGTSPMHLELEPVPDILAHLAPLDRPGQLRIGFALEPASELESNARRKLEEKQLAGIVANPIETLESDSIDGLLLLADGSRRSPGEGAIPKSQFARWLAKEVRKLRP